MKRLVSSYSSFLFSRPSAVEGVARSIDLGATLQEYYSSQNGTEADSRALDADFRAVSDDLRQTMFQNTEKEKIEIRDELLAKAREMLNISQLKTPALTGK